MNTIQLISVIGGAECSPEQAEFAEDLGKRLAQEGYGIVCGGRGGVMEAVCRGSWSEGGFTLGILPGRNTEDGNRYLSVSLPTGLGEARNVLVVSAGKVVVAIGGSYGTLSEIAHARRMGKPVIGFQTWDARSPRHKDDLMDRVESTKDAINRIKTLL